MSDSTAALQRDVVSLIDLLRRRHRLVLMLTLLGALAAAVLAFVVTPTYRSAATLIAANDTGASAGLSSMLGDLGGLASLAGVSLGNDQAKVEAEALLQSRAFIESFISDNKLLPKLFERRWDGESKQWRKTWRHQDPPTLYDGFKRFDEEILDVTEDKKTGIVTVTVDWRDPAEGAAWANELIRRLNEAMRQRAIKEADDSLRLLTVQLSTATQVELQQAISRGIETYVKQRTLASVRPEYAFRIIDPAKAADLDDYIAPKRTLYVASGAVLGFLAAALYLLVLDFLRRERPPHVR